MTDLERLLLAARQGNGGLLGSTPHEQLYLARMKADKAGNEALAPYEHQAFAREFTQEHPFIGPPAMAILSPGYAAAKALGILPSDEKTTPPSLEQIFGAYRGIGQGMTANLRGLLGGGY